jgi:hypothetical protein
MRLAVATEHDEQVAFFQWLDRFLPTIGFDQRLAFAIPNGGKRHVVVAMQMKAEGVKPGVPDVLVAIPRPGFHGLFIEMKRRGGRVKKNQLELADLLRRQGYNVVIAWSFEEAQRAVLGYFGRKQP